MIAVVIYASGFWPDIKTWFSRGIIVPHQFVKAIGDVVVISRNAVPVRDEEPELPTEQEDLV